jgi:thiol:disulfide interchange protein
MKTVLLSIFFALTLFGANIDWPSDYKGALQEAKKEHKLVYLFITSDECGWCKKFAATTLQDEGIKKRLQNEFVTIHMSRDQVAVPKQFKTTPVPRHYFLNADGDILYASLGHRDVDVFDSFMDNAHKLDKENKTKEK